MFSINRTTLTYTLALMFTIGAVLVSLSISSVYIPLSHIAHIIGENTLGIQPDPGITDGERRIIWNIRLPRVILGLGVGAALALAGAAFQGLLRNPLADPYTIGVSSGASLGAVIVIFFGISLPVIGSFTLPFMAILFGFVTLMIVFGLVQLTSRSLAVETIILAGIIMSAFIGAIISLLIALGDQDAMTRIIYWLYGSVALRGWSYVQLLVPFLIIGSIMLFMHYRELNAMALGEEAAGHIGVNVRMGKIMVVAGASLLTGAAVAVSGTIGFVGLVIPHLVRLLTGPNHKHVLPISFLVGGGFLVLADLLARTIISPQEMPIGVLTALIGAPVFALLLIRKRLGKE